MNELNDLLSDLYVNCRNLECEFYSYSTMIATQERMQQYLQESPLNIDIINDPRLNKVNAAFKSILIFTQNKTGQL